MIEIIIFFPTSSFFSFFHLRACVYAGKIELLFIKSEASVWTNFGSMERDKLVNALAADALAYDFNVEYREEITHDSRALLLKPKDNIIFITPIGYHVNLIANFNGKYRIPGENDECMR